MAIHTSITFFLPVPGCPKGYLGPGGLYNKSSNVNCTGGAAGYIDRLVIGENHMYFGTPKPIYQSLAFDPEGKMSKNVLKIYYSLLFFYFRYIKYFDKCFTCIYGCTCWSYYFMLSVY